MNMQLAENIYKRKVLAGVRRRGEAVRRVARVHLHCWLPGAKRLMILAMSGCDFHRNAREEGDSAAAWSDRGASLLAPLPPPRSCRLRAWHESSGERALACSGRGYKEPWAEEGLGPPARALGAPRAR